MIRSVSMISVLLAAAGAALCQAGGCGGGGDTIGTQVVVQETNVPDNAPSPCPDSAFAYPVSVDRDCGGAIMVTVCADQVLCQNQIDAAVARLSSCDPVSVSDYNVDVPASCQ